MEGVEQTCEESETEEKRKSIRDEKWMVVVKKGRKEGRLAQESIHFLFR